MPTRINGLPAATQANATDVLPKDDGITGTTQKLTVLQIIDSFLRAENYGGNAPTWTPIAGVGFAIDTSNDAQWTYVNGAWI